MSNKYLDKIAGLTSGARNFMGHLTGTNMLRAQMKGSIKDGLRSTADHINTLGNKAETSAMTRPMEASRLHTQESISNSLHAKGLGHLGPTRGVDDNVKELAKEKFRARIKAGVAGGGILGGTYLAGKHKARKELGY